MLTSDKFGEAQIQGLIKRNNRSISGYGKSLPDFNAESSDSVQLSPQEDAFHEIITLFNFTIPFYYTELQEAENRNLYKAHTKRIG